MTLTTPARPAPLRAVTFDLYRDIHKGIRQELFAVTATAGSLDPADRNGRVTLAARVRDVVALLVSHAHHEDDAIQPALEEHAPELAAEIAADHHALDARLRELGEQAGAAADPARREERRAVHELYVDFAAFTSTYLAHQDLEERAVMPALEDAIGAEAVAGIHAAIIGSIPPDEMARSLAVMLPAMNVDDRSELLGAMRQNAPAAVFEGVWGLATSVLPPGDLAAVAARIGVG